MYSNSDYLSEETMSAQTSAQCRLLRPEPLDIKPTICLHGLTVETCDNPDCATFEISKILDTLQNFERQKEGTTPLAAVTSFDFQGPHPTSPSQWEDFHFDLMPTADLPGHTAALSVHQQPQAPYTCSSTSTDQSNLPLTAAPRSADSVTPLPRDLLTCRMTRQRHISSSVSEGYSSDHTVPSPGPQASLAEIEKKERRKEQNRRAAKKCRIKKRAQTQNMQSNYQTLERDNDVLKDRVQVLEKEKQRLEDILHAHMATCNLRINPETPHDKNMESEKTLLSLDIV